MTHSLKASLTAALLILGATAAPAWAQFPPPAGTSVQQLIAHFHATDLLVGETSADGKWLIVRHAPSAMACRLPADGEQNVLYVQSPGGERGKYITCGWIEGKTGVTISAAPADGRTAAQGLAAHLEDKRDSPLAVTAYEGPARSALPEGVVEGAIVNDGLIHRLAMFENRGWLILMDIAYFPDNASEGEQVDKRVLRDLVADVRAVR